mmetsp:Transcript_19884/g.58697  ORF Transcript_19884/g.58697 Transcript_19884/m.58697 type:complete len:247 (-) Transcript_19884:99-839(-)
MAAGPMRCTAMLRAQDASHLLKRVLRVPDGVPDDPRVFVELEISPTLVRLVPEEVDHGEGRLRQEIETEGLVPAGGRAVDPDLPADGEAEPIGRPRPESLKKLVQHPLAEARRAIRLLKGSPLSSTEGGRAPYDAHIARAHAPLKEGAAVAQAGALAYGLLEQGLRLAPHALEQLVEALLELSPSLLAYVLDDGLAVEQLVTSEGVHPVLREDEVETLEEAGPAQLALLLLKVPRPDDANKVAARS